MLKPASVPSTSRELPLGAIRAHGWLLDQLRLQAAGLTGKLEDIWPDVAVDSGWRGGAGEDWERGPYYLDGLIPLAYLLDDPELIAHAAPWIEWILGSQDDTGFFGPATNRDWWPRMVALKALTQYADATQDVRVEPFLASYFRFQLEHLPHEPLAAWGKARGADNVLSVRWLYDRTGAEWLLELCDVLQQQTTDWDDYLSHRLITGPARTFSHLDHGPNVAMGLKTGAVARLRDGNPDHRAATELAFAELDRWHGQVHGFFSGDEWLGGREATAGVETCQVVELMFTLEKLAQIYGGGIYGDRLEALAFNLLAASCDPNMLAHQYHQQANQVQVSVGTRPWTHSSDDANIFGLEPHFGCCTANLHQGWPKFVRSLWMQDADGGLRAIAYAPSAVETVIDGNRIHLDIDTTYPFDETIIVRVEVEAPVRVPIRLRIPEWAHAATITVAGSVLDLAGAVVDGYADIDRTWSDGDVVELVLPMQPRVVRRERQAVGVRLGPLVLALRIPENWTPVPGAPGLAEWEVHPRTSWNFALARATDAADWPVTRTAPGPVPFRLDDAPVRVAAHGAHVRGWGLDGVQAGTVPDSPVFDAGPQVDIELIPYGSARLRIAEFPILGTNVGVESDRHH